METQSWGGHHMDVCMDVCRELSSENILVVEAGGKEAIQAIRPHTIRQHSIQPHLAFRRW